MTTTPLATGEKSPHSRVRVPTPSNLPCLSLHGAHQTTPSPCRLYSLTLSYSRPRPFPSSPVNTTPTRSSHIRSPICRSSRRINKPPKNNQNETIVPGLNQDVSRSIPQSTNIPSKRSDVDFGSSIRTRRSTGQGTPEDHPAHPSTTLHGQTRQPSHLLFSRRTVFSPVRRHTAISWQPHISSRPRTTCPALRPLQEPLPRGVPATSSAFITRSARRSGRGVSGSSLRVSVRILGAARS